MTDDTHTPTVAERLHDVQVGLRPELEFTRHIFRGEVSYIVRDPITFQSHRLELADYRIVVELRSDRILGDVFDTLVRSGQISQDDEDRFYEFIVSLHQLGFLNLPFAEGDRLYRRFLAKRAAARRRRLSSMFFFRVPLVNPDAFVTRTMSWVRFVFTKPFLISWISLQCVALFLLVSHWQRFLKQFDGFLQLQNLAVLWGTMVGLKVIHELGHAYACKRYGGHVPEMGAFFILFTPCAYVDATSAWSFTRKWHRLVVNFGGMYFELTVAALAMIAWCILPTGVLGAFFHNIVFLASILTIGFNVNPLMRFDGYYALSDGLEVPNLRQRSTEAIQSVTKRWWLGVDDGNLSQTNRLRLFLCSFGIACALYRVTVVLSIATVIATKFFIVGVSLGAVYCGTEVTKAISGLFGYLWFSKETLPVRRRAIAISGLLVGGAILLVGVARFPTHVYATGVVRSEKEQVVRAKSPGTVREVRVEEGQWVRAQDLVALLDDPLLSAYIDEAAARVRQSEVLIRAYDRVDRVRADQERESLAENRARLNANLRTRDRLAVTAIGDGRVVRTIGSDSVGRYLAAGDWIATIGEGRWLVEVLLDEDQISMVKPKRGDEVAFRAASIAGRRVLGVVLAVEPVGSARIEDVQLTQHAGGDIQVNPYTSEAARTFFRVQVAVSPTSVDHIRHGMTGRVQLKGEPMPLGRSVFRRLLIFLERLKAQ